MYGVQIILGYFVGGTNYPRIFCREVQNILGYFVGGAKYPGYYVGGCKIS